MAYDSAHKAGGTAVEDMMVAAASAVAVKAVVVKLGSCSLVVDRMGT